MSAENAAVVSLAREGQVLVVTIQNPPVNALSQAVRQGLADAVAQARSDAQVQAILLVGSGKAFIAGADIREFGKPAMPPSLPDVLVELENSDKLVVAAIHGPALGGGLEVALSC
ncbi:enoyl-CoA hydratase/isomerase family protein, partial [Comamonas sp. B-9]|uniref:enoyl-CoA hydratase/isomerase family protein n=1 Tax=Comamonas sp. B-9 TaxID=1055192 RepID=UPI0005BAD4EE